MDVPETLVVKTKEVFDINDAVLWIEKNMPEVKSLEVEYDIQNNKYRNSSDLFYLIHPINFFVRRRIKRMGLKLKLTGQARFQAFSCGFRFHDYLERIYYYGKVGYPKSQKQLKYTLTDREGNENALFNNAPNIFFKLDDEIAKVNLEITQ